MKNRYIFLYLFLILTSFVSGEKTIYLINPSPCEIEYPIITKKIEGKIKVKNEEYYSDSAEPYKFYCIKIPPLKIINANEVKETKEKGMYFVIEERKDGLKIENGKFQYLIGQNYISIFYENKSNKILFLGKEYNREIVLNGQNILILKLNSERDNLIITFIRNSPYFTIKSNNLNFSIEGELFIHSVSTWWGADINSTEEWYGDTFLYYFDWALVKKNGINIWISPTRTSSPLLLNKSKNLITIEYHSFKDSKRVPKPGQPYGKEESEPWQSPLNFFKHDMQEVKFGILEKVEDGNKSKIEFSSPLILYEREGNFYIGENIIDGMEIVVKCEDRNNNGPDFTNDIWYFVKKDGKIISKFEFIDENNDKKPDILRFYGDYENFERDGYLSEKELNYPLVEFHDWTKDGLFFYGNYFEGGANQRDWFKAKMHWSPSDKDKIEDEFTLTEYALDLDGDNDWDVFWRKSKEGKEFGLVFDIGDINSPLGIFIDPLTGYFYYRFPHTYCASPGTIGYAKLLTVDKDNNFILTGWGDMPQCDLNLDEDESPECHVMSQPVLTGLDDPKGFKGKIVHYTENRMTLDMDNDNFNVINSPYAPTFSRGRSFDMMISAETFLTPKVYERLPVFPCKPCVFRDPYGNELIAAGKYVPDGWDGKKLKVLDEKGKTKEWVYAWEWATKQKWDAVGCVWREKDNNPEAMQIFAPSDCSEIRFDCDINQNTDFSIYYSPISGFCHLKGADWGWYLNAIPYGVKDNSLVREYGYKFGKKREEFRKDVWWDIEFDLVQWVRDVDCGRCPFGWYESYFDSDNDGYYDIYLKDGNNDGIYEKRIYYKNRENKLILIENNKAYEISDFKVSFPCESILFDNYKNLVSLYKKSKENLDKRIIDNIKVNEKGEVEGWEGKYREIRLKKIGILDWSKENLIGNHFKNSLSRLITSISKYSSFYIERLEKIPDDWDKYSLLILPLFEINEEKINIEEVKTLKKFIENGGRVILICSNLKEEIFYADYLLSIFGLSLSCEKIEFGVNNDPTLRFPDEFYPKLKEKISGDSDIIKNIRKLYFNGYWLEKSSRLKVLLEISDKILIGEKRFKKGILYIISNPDLITNRFTSHNARIPAFEIPSWYNIVGRQGMNESWQQPDNNILLNNLIFYILGGEG